MSYISVDIEADGPVPGLFSMVSLGAVIVRPGLTDRFYAEFCPQTDRYQEEALRVCGYTREQTIKFPPPGDGMTRFDDWLSKNCSPGKKFFISDNNGFDWQFVNFYCWYYLGRNPFGHSSTNLGSLYKGLTRDTFSNFKHLRTHKHTHNALDDALGNAGALLHMKEVMGLKIRLD